MSETVRLHGEPAYAKDKRLMAALDAISTKFGRGAVHFGAPRCAAKWQMKAEMRSRGYTTSLADVLRIV